ncbi:GIY-YIG nuclease family protein [Treponema primitia]|uniref:NUMOD3 domain-containing DNA-binding protein n=1 Tax=Treponema primitia TaxID=88058 RepID=UPI00397FAA3A
MAYGIIYKATNSINGKVYVGQTTLPIEKRKAQHKSDAKIKTGHFQNAIRKHGFDAFVWMILDTAEGKEELDAKEEQWIKIANSCDNKFGYNVRSGGSHGKLTEEAKNRISISRKGILPWNTGKKMSAEHCKKLSDAHIGIKPSPESNEKRRKTLTGITRRSGWHHTEEVKQHLREIFSGENAPNFGRHFGDETRRKISEAKKGTKHTDEAKKKISEAGKGRTMPESTKKALWEGRLKTFQYPVELVIKIKTDIEKGERMCDISKKYGIAYSNVKAIKNGRAYKHVTITAVSA